MLEMPLVAVITPVFQGADYLAQALESVQAQSYTNLLHVVLDNASTDATPEILQSFQGRRVPLIVHRNPSTLSQVENWNRAFALAPPEASYLRLLCHDDTLFPEAIARCVAAAQAAPDVAMVGCNHFCLEKHNDFGWPADQPIMEGAEAARRCLTGQSFLMAPQIMLDRRAVAMRTPLFDGSFSGWDLDALLDLLSRGCKFAFVQDSLCMTRVHPGSVSSTVLERDRMDLFQKYVELHRYGARVFDGAVHQRLLLRYRRYYLRKLIRWSWQPPHGPKSVAKHRENLAALGQVPGPLELLDSMVDWPLGKLGLRPKWRERP